MRIPRFILFFILMLGVVLTAPAFGMGGTTGIDKGATPRDLQVLDDVTRGISSPGATTSNNLNVPDYSGNRVSIDDDLSNVDPATIDIDKDSVVAYDNASGKGSGFSSFVKDLVLLVIVLVAISATFVLSALVVDLVHGDKDITASKLFIWFIGLTIGLAILGVIYSIA